MKLLWMALALMICCGSQAFAGPNAGGILLVHYNEAVPVPGEPGYVDGGLANCAAAVTQAPVGDLENQSMWFIYAAFPQNASPRVSAVTFAVDFDPDQVALAWWATRPGAVEVPYELGGEVWPNGNTGISVAFAEVLLGTVSEVYCFAGYGFEGGTFAPSEHPDPHKASEFADDGPASVSDLVVGYGTLGFGVPGSVECPADVLTGACCRGLDGNCVLVPEGSCNQVGDFYLGNGTVCPVSGNCTNETGACCTVTVNGACSVMSFGDCEDDGGFFAGFGITCSPNPVACDQTLGACCTGSTCTITIQKNCVDAPANWNVREACLPNFCVGGACCIESNGACYIMRQPVCIALGNLFDGGPVCSPNPCPQPGACCSSATGDCSIRTAAECALAGDTYLGDGVTCGDPNDPETNPCPRPDVAACCNLVSGDCVMYSAEACGDLGDNYAYQGDDTVCSPNPCEPGSGACCLVSTNGACEIRTLESCAIVGGLFGGLDVACSAAVCPDSLGACCTTSQVCTITSAANCAAPSEWTALAACLPAACQTLRACCMISTLGGCAVISEQQCADAGGLWFQDSESCAPIESPCLDGEGNPIAWGACCIEGSGQCQVLTQDQCNLAGGLSWGANLPCTPGRCLANPSTGACCTVQPDGNCEVITQNQCIDRGGWYRGDNQVCDPNPCPADLGACCNERTEFGGGACTITVQGDCAAPNIWRIGALCNPSACSTPIERTTWGRIKVRYH